MSLNPRMLSASVNTRLNKTAGTSIPSVSHKALKSSYKRDLNAKIIPGFVQFTSFDPLTVGLWSEKNIELFRQMSQKNSFFVDATGAASRRGGVVKGVEHISTNLKVNI